MIQAQIEARVYSQYGEDGLIAFLLGLIRPEFRERWFIDLGAGNGKKRSNTFALSEQGYGGVLYEPVRGRWEQAHRIYGKAFGNGYVIALRGAQRPPKNCPTIPDGWRIINRAVSSWEIEKHGLLHVPDKSTPDFIDIDIDGEDWYVARAMLRRNVRPKIWQVEYNPNFGPEMALTVPRDSRPPRRYRNLFYGASLFAWRRLMKVYGYRFVCVESHGSNAFFVNATMLYTEAIEATEWKEWADLQAWREQFGTIGERLRLMRDVGLRAEKVPARCA